MWYNTKMVSKIGGRKPRVWFLSEWMAHRDIDDQRLADRLDVARETVTRWRNNRRRPDFDALPGIAHALGIETYQLFTVPPADGRPSVDAELRDAPHEVAQRLADLAKLWKTGT